MRDLVNSCNILKWNKIVIFFPSARIKTPWHFVYYGNYNYKSEIFSVLFRNKIEYKLYCDYSLR